MKIISIFLLGVIFMGCSMKSAKELTGKDSDTEKFNSVRVETELEYPEEDSVFSYSVKIYSIGEHSLEVKTRLINDSSFFRTDASILGNKVVFEQEIIFKKHDSILARRGLPLLNVTNEIIRNGKRVLIPRYLVNSVFLKTNNGHSIFIINANSLSNGSNEYSFYYSELGEQMAYINCGRHDCDTIGDFKRIKSFAIDEDSHFSTINIFPPEEAGRVVR